MNTKLLHIIYVIEIFISTIFKYNDLYFKVIIFSLFSLFILIVHINDMQINKLKQILRITSDNYNDLIDFYNKTIEDRNKLRKEVKNFDIPLHIKLYYINFLISQKHKCSICLSSIEKNDEVFLTLCGHLFHNNCINHDFNNSNKCPNCRKNIPEKLDYGSENDNRTISVLN